MHWNLQFRTYRISLLYLSSLIYRIEWLLQLQAVAGPAVQINVIDFMHA